MARGHQQWNEKLIKIRQATHIRQVLATDDCGRRLSAYSAAE